MRVGLTLGVLVALPLVAAGSTAFAEGAAPDEVTLKDGGTVVGTVVSVDPGKQVKLIEIGSSTARVIPWSQVADVLHGEHAPKSATEPGDAGPGYGGIAAPLGPIPPLVVTQTAPTVPHASHAVRLHIESPKPVSIWSPNAVVTTSIGSLSFVASVGGTVCSSPCDQQVPFNDGDVFVAQGDFPGRKTLSLSNKGGSVDLDVKPGSYGKIQGGVVAIVGGTLIVIIGTGLAVAGAEQPLESMRVYDPTTNQTTQVVTDGGLDFEIAGGCLIAGGVGIGALGAWLIATSGTSWNLHPSGARTSRIEPWVAPSAPPGARDRTTLPRGLVAGVRGRF